MMADVLARNWPWIAVRGGAAILFGMLTLLNPAISLAALVLLFGAYALVDGIFMIIAGVANRRSQPGWGIFVISGIISIILALLTFTWPAITALVLLLFIAGWSIAVGIAEIVAAIRLRKLITGEWLLVLAGLLAVLFGIAVALFPGAGALAVLIWIGVYALVSGVLLIVLAFRLRRWLREHPAGTSAA